MLYFEVILPLKLAFEPTYSYEGMDPIAVGSRVKVVFSGREYHAVVSRIHGGDFRPQVNISHIAGVETLLPNITREEIILWRQISDYYLCPIGLVYKTAYPNAGLEDEAHAAEAAEAKARKAAEKARIAAEKALKKAAKKGAEAAATATAPATAAAATTATEPAAFTPQLSPLSDHQSKAFEAIKAAFAEKPGRPVLLKGVPASGKTHIYMQLACEALSQGRSVLYLASELAYSRQLQTRLEKAFGKDYVLPFNSNTTIPRKRETIARLRSGEPTLVIGARSSVFLPFGSKLGLIIVDEENDASYKNGQGPYFNGRDAAIFMSAIYGCPVLLGTATPSLETIYNVHAGKYAQVSLDQRYYENSRTSLEIIDTEAEWGKFGMHGSFSRKLAAHISDVLKRGEQAIILRTWKNSRKATETSAAKTLEEETREIFPSARIAWIDNTLTTKQITEITESFSAGEIDILLGTRILSKGFDFSNVTLVALLGADSLTGREDFRSDEQAFSTIIHLWGRCARHSGNGLFVIQTKASDHPVLQSLSGSAASGPVTLNEIERHLLSERHEFGYPPYTRIIDVRIKDSDYHRLDAMSNLLKGDIAISLPGIRTSGPFTPSAFSAGNEAAKTIRVFLPKDKAAIRNKGLLAKIVKDFESLRKYPNHIIIDVDPL